jgi:hypothetical protein
VHIRRLISIMLALGCLAGCSAGGDRASGADAAATGLFQAIAARDGHAACALLAPDTAAEVAQSGNKPCTDAILDEDLPSPGAVTGTDVYGQWAQVRLTGDTVFVAAFTGGWRVVAAGCKPRAERPFDCSVQGG